MPDNITQLLSEIQAGSFKAIARGITIVENELAGYDTLLTQLQHKNDARIIGITGPPGAGKSTVVNALLHYWAKQDKRIAVIAVDPSSPFNYGALLGDRIRMSEFYTNPGIFIRSLASRGALGGLNAKIIEITDLVKQAPFDYILVETVGVGQSEVEIAGLADCTIVALVPEAGDEVQAIKAGIMEIANIFVLNKADHEAADALYNILRIMVHEKAKNGDEIPVIKTVATEQKGIEELANAIQQYMDAHHNVSDKHLYMLTEKSWQLIQSHRMKDIDRHDLKSALADATNRDGFNLYRFVQEYLAAK